MAEQPQTRSAAEMARNSLLAYASAVDESYRPALCHAVTAAALEAVERGEITRLLIMEPPRHGKSKLASELFPAWWKGRNPRLGIVHATYAQDLADDFGRKVRGLMGTEAHLALFPDSRVDPGSDSIRRFHTVRGGSYYAAGVGGPVTGRGGHLLLLDDPYKNRQDADSPVIRASTENWYRSTFRTRLHNIGKPGAIVVIMTHWHDQDIAGVLEREGLDGSGERWVVLRLRARAEADDPLGRPLGAPLWPEGGFDDAYLADMERAVGPREWAALFQQRPSAVDGNIFERVWWRWWCPTGEEGLGLRACDLRQELDGSAHEHRRLPRAGREYQSWDTAVKSKQTSDFVVGLHAVRDGADLYLTDREKFRGGLPETMDRMRAMSARHPGPHAKFVEARANGPAAVQSLRSEIPGLQEVEPQTLGTDKEARWHAAAPAVRSGNVHLPRTADWAREFVECMAAVPATEHDDDADALSQLVIKVLGGGGRGVIRLMAEAVEKKREAERERGLTQAENEKLKNLKEAGA